MKKLAALLVPCALMAQYQSLTIPSGTTVSFHIPATTPWSSLGGTRIAFRMHNFTLPVSGNVTIMPIGSSPMLGIHLYSNGYACMIDTIPGDSLGDYSNADCLNVTGLTDVMLRFQRFPNLPNEAQPPTHGYLGQLDAMGMDMATGNILMGTCGNSSSNAFGCPLSPSGGGTPVAIDGNNNWGTTVGFSLAWFKWFSTTVVPGSPLENESTQADLADFAFEGNYVNNATTAGVTMSTVSGTPSFGASPTQAPICYPFQNTYRSTLPATLVNNSYALDGSTPSYLWQQVSGPTTLIWSSRTAAAPVITGTSGTYNLQLTVTGSSGSTSCTVKEGFVTTDSNNVITTGNSLIDDLNGPQVMMGTNAWTWYDVKQVSEANKYVQYLATGAAYNNPFWNTAGAGTITYTTGSKIVTGSGTNFQTLFCGGGTSPVNGANINIWNPNALVSGGTQRRRMGIASCDSATQITLSNNWNAGNHAAVGDCHSGGCSYAYNDTTNAFNGPWISQADPADFYDIVGAFYSLYYRTGIDTYLNYARILADNWYVNRLDSGWDYNDNSEGFTIFALYFSPIGMFLRGLDNGPLYWNGLPIWANWAAGRINTAISNDGGALAQGHWFDTDPRNSGYDLMILALDALTDPNSSQAATDRTNLVNAIENGVKTSRFPDGNWYRLQETGPGASFSCGGSQQQCNNRATSTTIQLTNGQSTAVICDSTGTTCPATAGGFSTATPGPLFYNLNSTNFPACLAIVTSPTVAPASNADILLNVYMAPGTPNDGYHLNLVTYNGSTFTYTGTTGTYGWSTGNGSCGFGIQPYMNGIMGTALDFAGKALACVSTGVPTNCNNAASADAITFNIALANYNRTVGYNSNLGGMFYASSFANCQAPIASDNPGCVGQNSGSVVGGPAQVSSDTPLTGEALRGIMTAVGNGGGSTLSTFADSLYTQIWGKPGFSVPGGVTAPVTGGYYGWDYNGWEYPQTGGLGNFTTGTPGGTAFQKYFGMMAGVAAGAAWPGYRVGGLAAPTSVTVTVPMNLAKVPNATQMQITTVDPNGNLVQTTCSSAPCTISITSNYGGHQIWRKYLSAGGSVLAQDVLPVLHSQ